jgi:callose synthase
VFQCILCVCVCVCLFVCFLAAFLDVTLMLGAYRSTRARNVSRMLIRFFWFASLSAAILLLYIKTLQEEARSPSSNKWFRAFYWVLGIYAGFQLFLALVLRVPLFRMQLDRCSNLYIVQFVKWVHQVKRKNTHTHTHTLTLNLPTIFCATC